MANETRIFRIPPNMPVQAVASHVDHYLRANQGLQVQGRGVRAPVPSGKGWLENGIRHAPCDNCTDHTYSAG